MSATFLLSGDKKFAKANVFIVHLIYLTMLHCKHCYMWNLLVPLQIGIQWPTKLILVWANKMFVVVGV